MRLCQLRQEQLERFEEMTKLEVRILCRILPKSMNELDQLIPSDRPAFLVQILLLLSTTMNLSHEIIKKHQKWIRNHKRQMLAKNLEDYESAIEQSEFLYQEALIQYGIRSLRWNNRSRRHSDELSLQVFELSNDD